jgi:type II secretory pathway component PulF
MARLFSLFGLLIESGGSLEESSELAAGATPWLVLRKPILSIPARLRSGRKLHEALAEAPGLGLRTEWVVRVQVAETTGTLDKTLQELGGELEERLVVRAKAAAKLLPVLIYVLVGLFVLQSAVRVMGSRWGGI